MVIAIAPSQDANQTFGLQQLCSEMVVTLVSWLNYQWAIRALKPIISLSESSFAIIRLVLLKMAIFAAARVLCFLWINLLGLSFEPFLKFRHVECWINGLLAKNTTYLGKSLNFVIYVVPEAKDTNLMTTKYIIYFSMGHGLSASRTDLPHSNLVFLLSKS